MVIATDKVKTRTNYFLKQDEVKILWNYAVKKLSPKWKTIIAFALFRGLRIGEICAINILDFNKDITKMMLICEKSYIKDEIALIPFLQDIIKDYIIKNKHTFKDGYLFPYYSHKNKNGKPYMQSNTAGAMFCKIRKDIAKDHPEFLDCSIKGKYKRHRISFHSCRRWFETRIYDKIKDKKALSDIMRYLDSSTVDRYLDPYETWKHEQDILERSFEESILDMSLMVKSQSTLKQFC